MEWRKKKENYISQLPGQSYRREKIKPWEKEYKEEEMEGKKEKREMM